MATTPYTTGPLTAEQIREFTLEALQLLIHKVNGGELVPLSFNIDNKSVDISSGGRPEFRTVGQKMTFDFALTNKTRIGEEPTMAILDKITASTQGEL